MRLIRMVAAVIGLLPISIGGQGAPGGLHIALVSNVPSQARAEVVRFGGGDDRTFVLLDERLATEGDLIAALAIAEKIRARQIPSGATLRVPIVGHSAAVDAPGDARARARGILVRLQGTPRTRVGSLGEGRWMRLGDRR